MKWYNPFGVFWKSPIGSDTEEYNLECYFFFPYYKFSSDFAKFRSGSVNIKSKERLKVKKRVFFVSLIHLFFNQVGNNERITSNPCRSR